MNKRGFTLIEALTVVAVIGTLMTLVAYGVTQAQRQARDAKRKSDLTAISVSFQSRYQLRTCDSETAVNRYPGWSGYDHSNKDWPLVSSLTSYEDSCGPFSDFLSSVPTDPSNKAGQRSPGYIYDLSWVIGQEGRHFRLGARLERQPGESTKAEICRLSDVWSNQLSGKPYPDCPSLSAQNYFIGE